MGSGVRNNYRDAEVVCQLAESYCRWDLRKQYQVTGKSKCLSLSIRREVLPSAITIEALPSYESLARSL